MDEDRNLKKGLNEGFIPNPLILGIPFKDYI
jgi:hypothetical protein